MSSPTISVVIPTHRYTYLRPCLESILHQTRAPVELIVSQDGRDPAIRQLLDDLPMDGVSVQHVVNTRALGQLANRRQGFQRSTGEFVAMLDDDDEWESTFLERTSNFLLAHSRCGFCSTDHYIIDAEGRVLSRETRDSSERFGRASMTTGIYSNVLSRQLVTKPFSLHSTLFRRSVLSSIGFFPPDAGTVPDFALFLELGARDISAFYLAERLGRYRVHDAQQTQSRREPSRDQVNFLRAFRSRHELGRDIDRLIVQRFHEAVIELAIAHAHERERGAAFEALRQYGDMGWEVPRIRRIAVLLALMAGARKTKRRTDDVLLESNRGA